MKKRIAFISEHASPLAVSCGIDNGGQNVYVGELARNLVDCGFQVDIFTRWDNVDFPETVNWITSVRVIHVKAGPIAISEKEKMLPYIQEFFENMTAYMLKDNVSYSLIHANSWMSGLVAAEIKSMFRIPFAITFHEFGHVRKNHQREQNKFPTERVEIEKRVVQEADQIIAECPQDETDLIEYYNADRSKIVTVPCGFDPHEFYPTDQLLSRRLLHLDNTEFIMLQPGHMMPRKGIDNVIRALALLTKRGVRLRLLVVAGETDDIDPDCNAEIVRLQKLSAEEGVQDRVTFTGRKGRETLRYYYAAADVFISTPWYEPFGITPLKAIGCKTPVVGFKVGVDDGKTGFLVPPEVHEALAEKILELLNDSELRDQMKQQVIQRVNTFFRLSSIAEQMANVYSSMMQADSRPLLDEKVTFIENAFQHASSMTLRAGGVLSYSIAEAADHLSTCFRNNKRVLVCGNGGSAAESQHLVAQLLRRFQTARPRGLYAIALTTDSAFMSNDFSYEDVFARHVEAYGQQGDILFCFSTSGNSENVIRAARSAIRQKMTCIAVTGNESGGLAMQAQINIIVPCDNPQRTQELHLHIFHILCSLAESGSAS